MRLSVLKLNLKLLTRWIKDLVCLHHFQFARKDVHQVFHFQMNAKQEIKRNENFDNKVFNLLKAAGNINEVIIKPGQIFSFWKIVGDPNKGFKKSRVIKNGKTVEEEAGGICQLSGILYFLVISAEIKVLERYNHSVDLYNEETRFAPLGTDATVVYGYKDLRFKNQFDFSFYFKLEIIDNFLFASIYSEKSIPTKKLVFEMEENDRHKFVDVKYEDNQPVNYSVYLKKIE